MHCGSVFLSASGTDAYQVEKDEMKSGADASAGSWMYSSECQGEKVSKDFSITALLDDIK